MTNTPISTDKKQRILGIIVQALIAVLTALSGVFTGCSLAV